MCTVVTRPEEAVAGCLVALCPEFPERLARELTGYAPDSRENQALVAVLRAFAPASVAVIEWHYFDLDYRSEFGVLQETVFSVNTPDTDRVHIFNTRPNRISTRVSEGTSMRDFVKAVSDDPKAYKGYAILRPQVPGQLGRSIVSPHGNHPALLKPSNQYRHVRTAVAEHVHLFGVRLTAVGVPFMEQDAHLQRCAHISAWICHYTAVLRGIVPRRTTAVFSQVAGVSGELGRQYPSEGVTSAVLCRALARLDLPPELITSRDLARSRKPRWHDRKELWEAAALSRGSEDWRRFWYTENLTSTVCRYLNSGIPVVLAREDIEHSQVVCGYLREEDIKKRAVGKTTPLHSDVASFLVSDDQAGPFHLVSVKDLVDILMTDPTKPQGWRDLALIVPVPSGMWLNARTAELDGGRILLDMVEKRLVRTKAWAKRQGMSPEQVELHVTALREVRDGMRLAGPGSDGSYAIRTYAINSNDFKAGFEERFGDPAAVRVVGLGQLPKYVWVIELLDRKARSGKQPNPAVVGTVVLDASTVTDAPQDVTDLAPLLVHLPGQISAMRPPWDRNSHWIPTKIERYFTGRWSHERTWLLSAHSTAARSKSAAPS